MSFQEEGRARLRRLRSKQAIALAMDGLWQEAIAANQTIVEVFPEDVDAHNRLGRAYMELGEYARSREAYSRTLELDPYNTIAEKNLRRLSHLGETDAGSAGDSEKVEPYHFIEETGKAGVVDLFQLAPPAILAKMVAGDKVCLKRDASRLTVENGQGEYLGQVEPKHGQRLIKFMQAGNEYSASIINSAEDMVTLIIREEYQHPSQVGQLSFPTRRGAERIRSYAGDRMLRRELEHDEEVAEDPGYTIISEEGEVLVDEFPAGGNTNDRLDNEE